MAVFYLVTALVVFIPGSLTTIAAVQAGQRPPFPWVLHTHAVLMGLWLSLLVAQSLRVAKRRVGRIGSSASWPSHWCR